MSKKMKDVFELPLRYKKDVISQRAGLYDEGIYSDSYGDIVSECEQPLGGGTEHCMPTTKQYLAIVHAVNTHDSLVEQLEVLKHQLSNSKVYPLTKRDKVEISTIELLTDRCMSLESRLAAKDKQLEVAVKAMGELTKPDKDNHATWHYNSDDMGMMAYEALAEISKLQEGKS